MTLYGLLVYPEVFSRGAALSPSLWIDAEKVKAMIRHARVKRNTVLYMDYGALEFADHPHSRSLFAEVSALSRGEPTVKQAGKSRFRFL